MNPRIQELAEQATKKFTTYFDGRGNITETYFDREKFAELIVKDCVAISKTWEDQLENAKKISESNAVGIVAYRISQHFGVEP